MRKPVIALSVGDAAGIGPEIAVRILRNKELTSAADIRLYGPAEIIRKAAELFAPEVTPDIVPVGYLPFAKLAPG